MKLAALLTIIACHVVVVAAVAERHDVIVPAYKRDGRLPPNLRHLYHWTTNRHFDSYLGSLSRGKLPRRPAKIDRMGQMDLFGAIFPAVRTHPVFYLWEDAIGGMGASKVEFYAGIDLAQNKKPRMIVGEVNPRARVLSVTTRVDSQGRVFRPDIRNLDGVDLIYHEHFRSDRPNVAGETPAFREWISASDNAVTGVKFRRSEILPFVSSQLDRLAGGDPVNAIAPSGDLNFRSPYSLQRAAGVLNYILTKQHPPPLPRTGMWH